MPASDLGSRLRQGGWRWLIFVHRWIGIVTCLFFTIWFLSGLVMIYVPFPALDQAERLRGLTPIAWEKVAVAPADALRIMGIVGAPRTMALEMRDRAPAWRIQPWEGEEHTLSAIDGRLVGPVDHRSAVRIASDFAGAQVVTVRRLERDQWTVAGSFDRHRPLWKVVISGAGGRMLYISSQTGAVVLDTDAHERFWNWLGSVPHWIYPTILRQDNAAWRQVVMWVSGPCTIGAIGGMWIGLARVRAGRRRFRGGRMTPYRGWMHWHHVSGLFGGLFLTTWIFSGWLSVDPFRLFASPGVSQDARIAYAGDSTIPAIAFDRLVLRAAGAKRVELDRIDGRSLLVISWANGRQAVLDAATLAPATLTTATIRAAAARLVPAARIVSIDRLSAPDAYWYAVGDLPCLPVLRVRYDDPAASWVHIDPATGRILDDSDRRRRLYRWAFDLLHKWDLNVLTLNRPLWDLLLWLLSLLGLATSVTGISIGCKRLAR